MPDPCRPVASILFTLPPLGCKEWEPDWQKSYWLLSGQVPSEVPFLPPSPPRQTCDLSTTQGSTICDHHGGDDEEREEGGRENPVLFPFLHLLLLPPTSGSLTSPNWKEGRAGGGTTLFPCSHHSRGGRRARLATFLDSPHLRLTNGKGATGRKGVLRKGGLRQHPSPPPPAAHSHFCSSPRSQLCRSLALFKTARPHWVVLNSSQGGGLQDPLYGTTAATFKFLKYSWLLLSIPKYSKSGTWDEKFLGEAL